MKPLTRSRFAFQRALTVLLVFSLVVNLLMLTMPLYLLQLYERVLPSRSVDTLVFLTIIAVAALAVLGALEALRTIVASRAGQRLEVDLGAEVLRGSMQYGKSVSTDAQPLRDLAQVRGFIGSRGIFALIDAPFAPLFIAMMWLLHPALFWITLAGAGVLLALALLNQWIIAAPQREALGNQSRAMRIAGSLMGNDETLRAMGMSDAAIALWGERNADSMKTQDKVDRRNAVLMGLSRTIRMILQIAILGVGGWYALKGEVSAGIIFAASIISGRALQPIDQLIGSWKQAVAARAAWARLKSLLGRSGNEPERMSMPPVQGAVSLEGVRVASPSGQLGEAILSNINLDVKPGMVVGIVGHSGAGKSTLARLLVGAQDPDMGTVRIDGTDMRNWDPKQRGDAIGYLPQEVELFPGTIRQNIARLDPAATDEAVLEAAQKSQVHTLIQSLPNDYGTMVGPEGYQPSVGQRQRIGLARAFYGNPKILVLDEPNANLDEPGVVALRRAIAEARKSGATIFIVAQRKEILHDTTHVLRLTNGQIEFFGTNADYLRFLADLRAKSQAAKAEHEKANGRASDSEATQDAPAKQPASKAPTPGMTAPFSMGTGFSTKLATRSAKRGANGKTKSDDKQGSEEK